jgi:predicted ATP-grasp superfamily ATP-dependent carboligase
LPVPVLLTNGDQRSALAVARSLHARGVEVLALAPGTGGYASRTRALREVVVAPRSDADPRGFLEAVREVVRRRGIGLVVPISDEDLLALDAARAHFGDVRLAMAAGESLRLVLDKRANLDLAALHGVPVPREFRLQHHDQLPEMIAQLGWPIVMKRAGSPLDPRVPHCPVRVRVLRDRAALEAALDALPPGTPFPLFQEFVAGEAYNLVCMAIRGEVVAIHQYQSLRTWEGCGVLRRTVPADVLLEAHARRLLRALDWDGVAHVGFFSDARTGRTGYMEVNGRFWGSTQASVDAGWDFPWWVYRWFVDGERPQVPPLRGGSETVWRYGDLQSLVGYLRGGASPTPGAEPGPRGAIRDFVQGWFRGARSETFRWDDPGPGLQDARQALGDAWRLAARTIGRPRPPQAAPQTPAISIALARTVLQRLRQAGEAAVAAPPQARPGTREAAAPWEASRPAEALPARRTGRSATGG